MTHFGGFLFVFLFILFIVLIGIGANNEGSYPLPWWVHLLLSPIYAVGSFIVTFVILIIMFLIAFPDKEYDLSTTQKTEIYSIGLNTAGEVHGSFVLGCGTINGETYPAYRFYTITEDGKYHLNEVNANNFDIVCTDTVAPCIVYNATQYVEHPKRLKFIFNEDIHSDVKKVYLGGTIYIPENSVVQSYKIQL